MKPHYPAILRMEEFRPLGPAIPRPVEPKPNPERDFEKLKHEQPERAKPPAMEAALEMVRECQQAVIDVFNARLPKQGPSGAVPVVGRVYLVRGPNGEHFHRRVEGGWAFGCSYGDDPAHRAMTEVGCFSLNPYVVIREATAEELQA